MLDLVIVGGGPAGIAAGIQARHMGLDVRIIEKDAWGGRLSLARKVENIPGLVFPLRGTQVIERLVTHARNTGVPMLLDSGESIDFRSGCFVVQGILYAYHTRTVIVATGVIPKRLHVPGLGDSHHCLFYSWRELPSTREKRIAVIGGGEAALDQACTLAEKGAKVTVIVRGAAARAFDGLVHEAQELGVQVLPNTTVSWVQQETEHLSLLLSDAERTMLYADYILASVGVTPSAMTISGPACERKDQGLYFTGDVCSENYRQAAIAFGDGIKKAMMVYDYVKGQGEPCML